MGYYRELEEGEGVYTVLRSVNARTMLPWPALSSTCACTFRRKPLLLALAMSL